MLVYANALKLQGRDAFDVAGHTIHGWLGNQLGFTPTFAELFRNGEWNSNQGRKSAWLRAYAADGESPQMYAWVLKHADDNVRGRQWMVELGLKHERGEVEFSCTIQTEELSVLVTDPVSAHRPRLIPYLLGNLRDGSEARLAPDVPGKSLRTVGAETDSYRALLADIESPGRDYPIVLVSPDRDGIYLVNPGHLQETLVGLAQVVKIDPEYNSFDMEGVLGRHYSAWGGALNLIQLTGPRGIAYGRFFLSEEVCGWGDGENDRISRVLAHVTHNTNVPRLRRRIRADGVARLALRRQMEAQRLRLRGNTGSAQDMVAYLEQGLDELTEKKEELQRELDNTELARLQLLEDNQQLDQDLRTERYKNAQLLKQRTGSPGQAVDVSLFMDLASRADQPSPRECLEAVAQAYPDRVEVLDSALETAGEHVSFQQGRRLLELLNRLCTRFVDHMMEGGDDAARRVFTNNEYAATESEGTQNNSDMRRARTFERNGHTIEMWRHLKIGVADDQRKAIRVYFEWLPDEERIIIGHCGSHLPIISH